MNALDIDFTDGTSMAAEDLEVAISVAKEHIAANPHHTATFPGMTHQVSTTATIYAGGKSVALVTGTTVQTLATDPGF